MRLNQVTCVCAILWLMLSACVSTALSEQDLAFIEKQKKYFSTCRRIDGGNYFTLQKDQKDLFAARMDWITEDSGNTSIELSNTIGGFLGAIELGTTRLELEGLPDELELTVDSDGFINVKGHRVGVKVDELPCILSFSLPSSWLRTSNHKQMSEGGPRYGFSADNRSVYWWSRQNRATTRVCVNIEWSAHFLLPSSNIDWCYRLDSASSSGELNLPGLYRFSWEASNSLEEEPQS